ncbi:hypothetical protein AX17_007084 [Amanita inopinata Kibby_2008]|nr:hypothetical protein AX17_007084 [Amanita inopinata Kibby_2008]
MTPPSAQISSIGSITFIDRINLRHSSKRTTNELVKQAHVLVYVASCSPKFVPQWLRRFGVDLDLFFRAMLECAPTALSKRYVASAILACRVGERDSAESVGNLQELAITWFGHFFWVFKSAGMDGMYSTTDELLDHYVREEVMQRDGNRCVITNVYDWRRARRDQVPKANLDYACILPRTTRREASSEGSKRRINDYFSPTSWDILRNYLSLSVTDEESLLDELESPANAITMELDAGYSYQQYLFSLEPSQEPEQYVIVAYEHPIEELCAIVPRQDRISLSRRPSTASSTPTSTLTMASPPSPVFLHIHSTLARVMYLSGAGAAIDKINEFLGMTHPVLRNLDFDSARVTLEDGWQKQRMWGRRRRSGKPHEPTTSLTVVVVAAVAADALRYATIRYLYNGQRHRTDVLGCNYMRISIIYTSNDIIYALAATRLAPVAFSISSLLLTAFAILPLSILRIFLPSQAKAHSLALKRGMDTRNQRKVVLVVGASRGIGYNVVREYAMEEGTTIIAVSRSMENLEAMASELGPTRANIQLEALDISTSADKVAQALNEWDTTYGPITHVYAVSAISNHLDDRRPWDLDVTMEMINVNVVGIVALVMAAFERMKARKCGSICIVGSVAGLFNPANMISYASTKAFINTFASSLRILALEHNVEVVTVTPGFIDTRMTARMRGQGSTVPAIEFASAHKMARKMKQSVECGGVGVVGWPVRQAVLMYALRGVNPICEDLGRFISYVTRMAGKKVT